MPSLPIAVIGLSARYAGGVQSPDELWTLLERGTDPIRDFPDGRWDRGFLDPDRSAKGRSTVFAGGYLDRIDAFDADFFGISAREAQQMEPQQRLLLELAWEAFEDAGVVPAEQAGSATGVYVGLSSRDYAELLDEAQIDAYTNLGLSMSIASNRVSYVFDLKGPSLTVDTACSSGMVALHQAMLALRRGDCTQALVGAVNLMSSPASFIGFSKASMLSPVGRCTSFDADGAGYVRAEGGGFLLLKPLDAAERDGDRILGVVLASGVNSDGRTMGIALPNPVAQAALLEQVYAEAGIAPDDVHYLEAHGTGTAVGDPIECEAIARVLGGERRQRGPLRIGSIKSNVGHLENAAGIAGITKVLLAMRHGRIPANLHFRTPNPKIDWAGWKLEVVASPQTLPDGDAPLHFGVNSFGFGGTNGHCVLRQYRPHALAPQPQPEASPAQPWSELLVLSAQSEAALKSLAGRWRDHLRGPAGGEPWSLVRANALHHRGHLAHRLVVDASSAHQAAERIDGWLGGHPAEVTAGRTPAAVLDTGRQRVAFVYAGNGPQWWAMGRQLMTDDPVFREAMEAVDRIFIRLAGWSLVEELMGDEDRSRMARTEVAQPTLFALQVGVTTVLRSAGIEADAVIGHSVGEAAAAWASGALTLEQATHVIHQRSMAQAATAGMGRMAALGVSADEAAAAIARIGGFLEIAAVNSPSAVTVAGDPQALQLLCDELVAQGRFARLLTLDYPFHTRAMDGIREGLLDGLAGLPPGPGERPFVSTVEGRVLPGQALDATYWWRNIREPVAFAAGVSHLIRELGIGGFIEIGPHPVLRDYLLQTAKACDVPVQVLTTLRRPRDGQPVAETAAMHEAVRAAYAQGLADPRRLAPRPSRRLQMPLYPWNRQRHWRGDPPLPGLYRPSRREHALLGWRVSPAMPAWEQVLDASRLGWLADHVIQDAAVFPGAGYIDMALAAGRLLFGEGPLQVEDMDILKPLALPASGGWPRLHTRVDPADGSCEIVSHRGDESTPHLRCRITRAETGHRPDPLVLAESAAEVQVVEAGDHYAGTTRRGMHYGPCFQGVRSLRIEGTRAVARIALPAALGEAAGAIDGHPSHPALLDACLQALVTLLARRDPEPLACIPVRVDRLRWFAPLPTSLWCEVTLLRDSPRGGRARFALHADDGACLMVLDATTFQKVDFRSGAKVPHLADRWRPDPLAARPVAAALGELRWPAEGPSPVAWDAEVERELDLLCAALAAQVLASLQRHAGLSAGDPFSIGSLQRRCRVVPGRRAALQALVDLAVASGAVERSDAGLVFASGAVDAATRWQALLRARPAWSAELMLLLSAPERWVAWLLADEATVAPPPNAAFLEAVHDNGPSRADGHALLGRLMAQAIAGRTPGRALRVLHLHAAAGGGVAACLAQVPSLGVDVALTDPDGDALDALLRQWSAHRAVRGQVLSLGALPPAAAPADVLVCADGLAASAVPVQQALRNAAGWLAPGGCLLLLAPRPGGLATLLHGMQDGGWRLPAASEWPALFAEAGGWDAPTIVEAGASLLLIAQRSAMLEPAAEAAPTVAEARGWLLIADADGEGADFADALATALAERGQMVRRLSVDPMLDAPELASAIGSAAQPEDTVVQLAGLAVRDADPMAMQPARCLPLIALAHGQQGVDGAPPVPVKARLVSRGAQAGPCGPLEDAVADPAQAAAWGLARVLGNEHPGLALRLVDLHLPLDRATAHRLADELVGADDETEVLLGVDGRWLNRVEPAVDQPDAAPIGSALRLVNGPGGLDGLVLQPAHRRAPAAGEVEIAVRAAGLNFRDVLWAMNLLPEEAVADGFSGATIGMECAGTVVAVGEGVTELRPGDRVIGFASGCFASHVTTAASAVARMPAGLGFEEAATLPTTFLTAWYALTYLARLEPGERVLVHGAAGGVGLAALQIARARGAVVFATAGSDDKRRLARLAGADHVLDSRSLAFADDVLALTGGEGIDVVLNSLAGEAITKNLQILRPFGRLLEIGKRDLYANSRIGLRPFRLNISYFGIDADTLLVERPALARRLFDEVVAELGAGRLRPLPFRALPVERAGAAFRLMQRSRHVGKIVLTLPAEGAHRPPVQVAPWRWTGGGTWLVTGGLGGFGLASAKWLASRGVRSLALMSRRGDSTDEAQAGIAFLRACGVVVQAHAGDVSHEADVARVLEAVRSTMAPLAGVLHAAMVLDDGPVHLLDRARLERVLAPKVAGAFHLHRLTREDPLREFVVFSSATVMFGNPGQGNYVAANQVLQAFAQWRRAQGLPALSVAWGAIRDVGVVTRIEGLEEMLQKRSGIAALDAAEALEELGRALAGREVCASVSALDLSRGSVLAAVRAPRMSGLRPAGSEALDTGGQSLAERWPGIAPEARRPLLLETLRGHLARILGAPAAQIDLDKPLADLGMDSLMAVELAGSLEHEVGRPVSVMQMIQAASAVAVVEMLMTTLGAAQGG
jgi:acyl transferase domain-containing protein/NADPH:quinone reductase-like Zn-dependent oxidoreductase/acyl carrier protein